VPALPSLAEGIPACALSGSMTMTIGGKPALRLSDVARCPPDLYEVIKSVSLDGQPLVHFKTGASQDTTCAATGDQTVSIEGKPASRLGDVNCRSNDP
jgi:uncharacterized Zn-binding protein involved in type VI secretion